MSWLEFSSTSDQGREHRSGELSEAIGEAVVEASAERAGRAHHPEGVIAITEKQ